MPTPGQAANGLYLTPSTNNDSSPPGTLPSPRHTMKRTFDDMKMNGAGRPHVPGAPSQNAADSTLTPVQTPPDIPADPRPGPGKEKGTKAVYDPAFDPALSTKEKQKYKARYKLFGAENEPSAPPDPRLAIAGYTEGLYHRGQCRTRVRHAPYVVKPYPYDPVTNAGRGPAVRVVVYGFDPFTGEAQIRALMGSYGDIQKLENHTDANGSFVGVCSITYQDIVTRKQVTKAHESARRAEKEGTGQKIGLKIVRIERDPEGTRATRYSNRVIKARTEEQQKQEKLYQVTAKCSEPPPTPATPIVGAAPPPNAPKGPSGKGGPPPFRPDFRPPTSRPIPPQHALVEKEPVLQTIRRAPYIFIAHCYVPVLGTTIEHLKKRMKSYNWDDVRCDPTGYFITFFDNRPGQRECERCFRDCHLQPLFTYTMNMECHKYGNPNYVRSPSPEQAAAERRHKDEKSRLRAADEADFENEKRERAENLDPANAALELLGPKLVSMIMNDIKTKIATPTLFDSLDPDKHRDKRRKFGIPDPSAPRPTTSMFGDREVSRPMPTPEWRPGTSLTWHRNKPISRFEKQKLRREIEKASQATSVFADERRKKNAIVRPARTNQLLHRRLQDFYESESDVDEETRTQRGTDEADSRAVSEIPQSPARLDEGLRTPKGKRRKTDKGGWAPDSEDEGVDAHSRNLLGHLIGKEPEDMAMRELEQVISTLPRTSKLRKRALTEVKLRKQAEEDDALFFGIKKQAEAPAPVVDIQIPDREPASTPEVEDMPKATKKKKAAAKAAVRPKKTKKQILEEQEAARKEAEAREKLRVALDEEEAPTPAAEELIAGEEEPRADVEWSVSTDRPRRTVEDDPNLLLDIDGWQHLLKDEEDLKFLHGVLEKEKSVNIPDVKLWAWEQKQIKALNNDGKNTLLSTGPRIEGYYVENLTGCARLEGVKKIAESEKSKYLPHRIRVQKQREEREAQAKRDPTAAAEATRQAQQAARITTTNTSRQTRVNNRRLVNDIAVQKQALGDDAVSITFNQLKKRKKLVKFDRSAIHNWGLYADENISAGEMIIEYVGELVRQQVANLREIKYQQQGIGSSYLFRIDDDLVVDATKKGGIARFINHSCSPCCTAKIIRVDNTKRIVIYALRDIKKNEELTYDYKFEREIGSTDRIPCLCGAVGCKGFLN